MHPPTRYVTADGARIAYQVFGQEPPTVVTSAGSFSHTDVIWEDPAAALFFARLASFAEVVRYDRLGTSNSDPFPPDWDPGWAGYARELEAVLSVVEAEKVVMFALLDAGPVALRFAAEHPDRVSKLILYNTTARFVADDDYPIGLAPQAVASLATAIRSSWGSDAQVSMNVPSRSGDDDFAHWYGKYLRAIGTPNTIAETLGRAMTLDARESLSNVAAPTLILHRSGYPLVPASHGRYLAEHVTGATYVELPGSDGPMFWETPDLILSHIRSFLSADSIDHVPSAAMAAVLFTDIVGSTERMRAVGDRDWKAVLGVHDEIAERTVAACGGRLVKSTGDGILATFPDPAKAVECARRLRRLLRDMGIPIRAGVHVGRVESVEDDIGGVAVHIAARVMAKAPDEEIAVSRTVRDLLLGSEDRFESLGSHTLKGVEGEWELFRAV